MEDIPFPIQEHLRKFASAVEKKCLPDVYAFYKSVFPSLTDTFFQEARWPSVVDVSQILNDEEDALILYELLYFRHTMYYLAKKDIEPKLEDRFSSWDTYMRFFSRLLDTKRSPLPIPPAWLYDIFDEFIYQYSDFLGYHRSVVAKADDGSAPSEEQKAIAVDKHSWRGPSVLHFLHSLMTCDDGGVPELRTLQYMAGVALANVHMLTGDYMTALAVGCEVVKSHRTQIRENPVTAPAVSLSYVIGFSLLMLDRYCDAMTVLLPCAQSLHRMFTRPNMPHYDQLKRLKDKILNLLAVLVGVCDTKCPDDGVNAALRDRINAVLTDFSAKKCIEESLAKGAPKLFSVEHQKSHLSAWSSRASRCQSGPELTRVFRTYANIGLKRFASLLDCSEDDCIARLTELRCRQVTSSSSMSLSSDVIRKHAESSGFVADVAPMLREEPMSFFVREDSIQVHHNSGRSTGRLSAAEALLNARRRCKRIQGKVEQSEMPATMAVPHFEMDATD